MGKLIPALALALLMSLLGHIWQGYSYLKLRDALTLAKAEVKHQGENLEGAQAVATACSDATDDLRELADKRAKAAAPARAAAASVAQGLQARADYTLRLRPKDPADMCASMQALGDEWLQGRAQK